jgi:hypothetical protein
MDPISTRSRAPRSVRKAKKRARKVGGGPADYQPKTDADKKSKRQSQNTIVNLYNLFEGYKKKIAELEKQKLEAIDQMAIYQQRLDHYKQMMGYTWAQYTEKDGLYMFQDSTTFDMLTQEFQFPASTKNEDFEIRLIAIPESSISDQADEVMLHINLVDAEPNYNARLQVELQDVFTSDSWELERSLFDATDSVALLQFFEGMLDKKVAFSMVTRGQGIGKWDGCRTIKNDTPVEESAYPGSTSEERIANRMGEKYAPLRRSELFIHLDRAIRVEINSYTDPVASSITITNPVVLELMTKYKLSKNDILSALRTATILNKFKDEINTTAGTYLTREQAKVVIDRFNKEWLKTKIAIGSTSIKLVDLKL